MAENGTHVQEGWPDWASGVAKIGISALTRIQQREFLKDKNRPDVVVNSVHPGYVDTDMTSHKGHRTIEQGTIHIHGFSFKIGAKLYTVVHKFVKYTGSVVHI